MKDNPTVRLDGVERLDEVATAYLKAVEAGETPDRAGWLAAHPEIAAELAEFFADADEVERLVAPSLTPLRGSATPSPASDPTIVHSPPASPGRLGDYELLKEVARGGMGVVYQARQISLQREVALKMILHADTASPTERQRFRAEAETAAQLEHPNIVPIFEVGEDQGRPFFTMKLIEGGNLAEHLPLPHGDLAAGIAMLAQVARAVHYAHQHAILHRDLKPSNVLLHYSATPEAAGLYFATPMITDFGLAKVVKRASDLTRTGAVVGTPSYMAPEQARGHGHAVTTAADVYGLGAILYELLTGRPPFRGATALETLMQVCEQEPERPRRLVPKLDRDLETICLKCLEKEPRRRYESAEQLAEDLERSRAGETILARPARPVERLIKLALRKPAVASLTLACVGLILAAIVLLVVDWRNAEARAESEARAKDDAQQAWHRAEGQTQEAKAARRLAEDRAKSEAAATIAADQARDEALRQSYYSRIGLAESHARTHNVVRVQQLLKDAPAAFRGWEWDYLYRLSHRELHVWRGHQDLGVLSVAFSSDGELLASLGWDKTVKLWNSRTEQLVWSHPAMPHWGATLAIHGDRIAFPDVDPKTKEFVVRVFNVTTKREVATLRGHKRPLMGVAFSKDGRRLASCDETGAARTWDPNGGTSIQTFEDARCSSLAFSPDGTLLALGGYDGVVRVRDLKANTLKAEMHGHAMLVHGVDFQPDGKLLASASFDHSVRLWNVAAAREVGLAEQNGFVFSATFSHKGRSLASSCCDQTIKVWDPTTQAELFTLGGHTSPVVSVAFSPTDDRLASCNSDGSIRIWDTGKATDALVVEGQHPVIGAALSPDGSHLAIASRAQKGGGEIVTHDLTTGRDTFTRAGITSDVAYAHDGKYLVAGTASNSAKLWDAASGAEVRTFPGHLGPVTRVTVSRREGRLACVSSQLDRRIGQNRAEVKIWEIETGKLLASLQGDDALIEADRPLDLAFSPDGRQLATAGLAGARTWDSLTGKPVFTIPKQKESVDAVAWGPDGKTLATASGLFDQRPEITFWSLESGKATAKFQGHAGRIFRLAFSPDGRRLASASMDRTVKIWDAAAGEEIITLFGHKRWVTCVAFSADGGKLISASPDRTVRIWDGTPNSH